MQEECPGPLAGLLWRAVSDVALWSKAEPEARGDVFQPETRGGELLAEVPDDAPELAKPLRAIRLMSAVPGLVDAAAVAEACGEIAAWAEARGRKQIALQFAEAAARLEPGRSPRSYEAGRACVYVGDLGAAAVWFRRAVRLARLAKSEIDFAIAHRACGVVLAQTGKFDKAEEHFWKCVRAALRVGNKSLAATGYHHLFAVAVDRGNLEEALVHGQQAVALYKTGHPRFPNLAHDVAFFWCRQGYFSSAIPIFKMTLPLMRTDVERMVVLASLARAVAAVRDNIQFQRTAVAVMALTVSEPEMVDSALYHVAEGARSFQEWERAEQLAQTALAVAQNRRNAKIIELAEQFLDSLGRGAAGDVDRVPEEGGVIDQTRETMLRKLRKQPAPGASPGAGLPQRYTLD